MPAVFFQVKRCRPSGADQRPSAPWTRLGTTTWVWSWGSPARLVRCRNAAPMNPCLRSAGPRRDPDGRSRPPWRGGRARRRRPGRGRPRSCHGPRPIRRPRGGRRPWERRTSGRSRAGGPDWSWRPEASPCAEVPASRFRRASASTWPTSPSCFGRRPDPLSGCLAPAEVVVVDVVGHLLEVVVGSAGGAEPPYRQQAGRQRWAIGPVHGRIVRMDVTSNVILADTGPSTRENLYSAVARNSARRAEGTLWCTGVECCVQVRRGRWKGMTKPPSSMEGGFVAGSEVLARRTRASSVFGGQQAGSWRSGGARPRGPQGPRSRRQ